MTPSVFDLQMSHRAAYVGAGEAKQRVASKRPRASGRGVLRGAREAGTLPYLQVGVKRVYPRAEFDAWLSTL